MKYGVIVCRQTENIGDDIQSYAAACLLPQVDYYIEREHMDVFRPKETEPVNAIINGWLMNNKLGWPVSACINPLYISMHFYEKDAMHVEDDFLEGIGSEDLLTHGPVGARDISTQRFLARNGVPCYFSGCLTLTLPRKFKSNEMEPYVCLTDVSDSVVAYVQNRYPNLKIRIMEHEPKKLPALVDQNADWNTRFRNVESLLETYQNASAVVTTRLHCAMPCLALETPVLLLNDSDLCERERMSGLSDFTHSSTTEDFIEGKANFDLENPPDNPLLYLEYREKLIQTVKQFVERNSICTPELMARFCQYDDQWEARALWKNRILLNLAKKHTVYWNQTHDAFETVENGRRWLEQQNNQIVQENSELSDWCSELEKAKAWLNEQYTFLSEDNRQLRKWITKLEEDKVWFQSQSEKYRQTCDALTEELRYTTEEKNKLENELQSIPLFVRQLANKLKK